MSILSVPSPRPPAAPAPAARSWLSRGGVAAFVFFLTKGLIWLGLAAAAWTVPA